MDNFLSVLIICMTVMFLSEKWIDAAYPKEIVCEKVIGIEEYLNE